MDSHYRYKLCISNDDQTQEVLLSSGRCHVFTYLYIYRYYTYIDFHLIWDEFYLVWESESVHQIVHFEHCSSNCGLDLKCEL